MAFTFSAWITLNLLLLSSLSFGDYPHIYPNRANVSTLWTFNTLRYESYGDRRLFNVILLNNTDNPGVGCGFYQNDRMRRDEFYFAVFSIFAPGFLFNIAATPRLLWTANRNKPVKTSATLELTSLGDLVLKDGDDNHVWSTNTSGSSVVGMRIDGTGNLILYNAYGVIIWQSFDHPTDIWLPGQKLKIGQRLVASASSNLSAGLLYISFLNDGLNAFIGSSSSQKYGNLSIVGDSIPTDSSVSMRVVGEAGKPSLLYQTGAIGGDIVLQYIKLDSDGHLRIYNFQVRTDMPGIDILGVGAGVCGYPTVCGEYGICSNNGQCSCPMRTGDDTSYFRQLNFTKPALGCVPTNQVSCENPQLHLLVELDNVDYFNFVVDFTDISIERCKQVCMKKCTCKAAMFRHLVNTSNGNCSLPSELFSLMTNYDDAPTTNDKPFVTRVDISITFLKAQRPSLAEGPRPAPSTRSNARSASKSSTSKRRRNFLVRTLAVTLFTTFLLLLGFVWFLSRKKHKGSSADGDAYGEWEDSFDQVSGKPKKFFFNELKLATDDFRNKLGAGGFGSVFEGNLNDGTKVAVKRLDQLGQGNKEFLAEVKTIGSIHHFNLVSLVGYCAETSRKLLVYDYMCNGSLDRWIFKQKKETALGWITKKKIILDVAKGLSYLHEECQKRIVHLDIKPQNILLDHDFNAKISDFGLARFIDRDESQVLTTKRGTRGYMAPELISNRSISEKVDVYSFGIVVLEIVCGRKIVDNSLPEEYVSLLYLVKRKVEEDSLSDLLIGSGEEMLEQHNEESVKMIRTAMWCLQSDCARRPSMTTVVKVLEGLIDTECILDFNFLTSTPRELCRDVTGSGSTPQLPSILSGPR